MSIKGWIEMARFIRNQILIIRDRDYNVASRCIGTPTIRIVLRNLLPYLVSVIMLRMALTIPAAIGSEVFITYIGLGLSVETPSLGNLINDGRKVMMQAGLRYQLLYPTLILSFVTIAFYLIGNASRTPRPEEPPAVRRDRRWKKISSSFRKGPQHQIQPARQVLHAIRGIDLDIYHAKSLPSWANPAPARACSPRASWACWMPTASITSGTIDYVRSR